MDTRTKRQREKEIVTLMITLYCRKQHGSTTLCPDCSALDAVADTKIPVFVIHGTKDDFVPTFMGKEIFEACVSEKELWLAEGAGHAESYYLHKEEYERKVLGFFHRCLEGDIYED